MTSVNIKLTALTLSLVIANTSLADTTEHTNAWYAAGKGAITFKMKQDFLFRDVSYKPGYDFGLAVGRELGNIWRVEGEVGYTSNKVKSISSQTYDIGSVNGNSSALYFLTNGYIDFNRGNTVTPFVGAGLGLASVDSRDVSNGISNHRDGVRFAYQVSGGLRAKINKNFELGASARYLGWVGCSAFLGGSAIIDSGNVFSGALTLTYRFA